MSRQIGFLPCDPPARHQPAKDTQKKPPAPRITSERGLLMQLGDYIRQTPDDSPLMRMNQSLASFL